jgi:hypothetical protein
MSSGEGAKPTSYEERNPFDISRRSQTEVAAEIAERMAAWKRARGRSYATPSPGAQPPSPASPSSPAEPRAPTIAAPVQPARLPKYGEHADRAAMPANQLQSRPSGLPPSGLPVPPRPATEIKVAAAASAPAASPGTAVQRAMPPAPTLRRPAERTEPARARPETPLETPSGLADVPARPSADAGAAETVPLSDDVAAGVPPAGDSHTAEAAMTAPAARAAEADGIAAREDTAPEMPQMATTSGAESLDRDERAADAPRADGPGLDRFVAEATLQAPLVWSPEAPAARADQTGAREPATPRIDAPAVPPSGLDRPGLDRYAPAAPEAGTQVPAAVTPEAADLDVRGTPARPPAMPRLDALAAEMHEAELTARARSASATLTPEGDAARVVPRKPLFDLRAARARASEADAAARPEIDAAAHAGGRASQNADATPAAAGSAGAMQDAAPTDPDGSSFEALDREAYRIGSAKIEVPAAEPPAAGPQVAPAGEESDRSKGRDRPRGADTPSDPALAAAADASGTQTAAGRASAPAGSAPAASGRRLRIAAPAPLTIEPADPDARMEPGGIESPSIETRIETRRIETLRADPWIAGRRPIFPRVEPEAWDIPTPAVAARAARQRSGTGWAIGLGALLLIVGITAPAAIWQGRQAAPGDQDQVATLAPPPASQAASEAAPPPASQAASRPQPDASPAPSASAPAQPQQAASPPPAGQAPAPTPSSMPSSPEPQVGSAAPEEEGADRAADQADLAPVRAGGELNKAPVSSPPPRSGVVPARNPPGKAVAEAEPAPEPDPAFSPVAHAFVPEAARKPTPFQPEPSPDMPVASAPANGASVPIDGSPASVTLKPSLIGQLKPQVADAAKPVRAAPQRAAGKPRTAYPPTLDQMFQNLIETLSSGQPADPSSKQIPPSTRR